MHRVGTRTQDEEEEREECHKSQARSAFGRRTAMMMMALAITKRGGEAEVVLFAVNTLP